MKGDEETRKEFFFMLLLTHDIKFINDEKRKNLRKQRKVEILFTRK